MTRPKLAGVRRLLSVFACIVVFVQSAPAQDGETFVINLRNAEIAVLAEQVSAITGRTLVLDPALNDSVTVISAEPLDREGIWALFQSILSVRGFTAVPAGAIWEVVPEADARSKGGDLNASVPGTQDSVTRLLRLNRLPAAEAVRDSGALL